MRLLGWSEGVPAGGTAVFTVGQLTNAGTAAPQTGGLDFKHCLLRCVPLKTTLLTTPMIELQRPGAHSGDVVSPTPTASKP